VDDLDHPVAEGAHGHLLTRGPYTIRAYHDAPEANARAFTADGFYRTGDIVSRSAGGYLTVHGRATDQINRGGEKVSPDEIEDHLLAHPDIHDAAIVGVPDPYLGERVWAVIVPLREGLKTKDVRAWLRTRGVAAYKIPDQVAFVPAFPETRVGKTSRKDLRAAVRESLDQEMTTPSATADDPAKAPEPRSPEPG
jgi:2,3-dihydroxybenzoate-AMP ligase